jgi:HD-like signal output (HDOD) protein
LPFLCGLLCEVGALACIAVDGPGYLELRKRTISVTGAWSANVALVREDLEILRYGVTTRTIGARLLRRHRLPEEIARAVEAGPRLASHAPLLHRATAFARLATPVLVIARGLPDSALRTQLAELAKLTAIGVDSPELERICLGAAANAERSLRSTRSER